MDLETPKMCFDGPVYFKTPWKQRWFVRLIYCHCKYSQMDGVYFESHSRLYLIYTKFPKTWIKFNTKIWNLGEAASLDIAVAAVGDERPLDDGWTEAGPSIITGTITYFLKLRSHWDWEWVGIHGIRPSLNLKRNALGFKNCTKMPVNSLSNLFTNIESYINKEDTHIRKSKSTLNSCFIVKRITSHIKCLSLKTALHAV